ncbi:hypothetical protein AH448_25915 [Salmonella enterica subsp. diarizonae]|uniref:HicB-like antitoxin of toxin-antitoxin system domain-containing protein n=5 Tax=Salmonella enterica TaxID=28901 RepID=A0A5U3D7H5_SALDZ|nr:hypothetical protein [Salmonella enterica]EAA7932393.1 hypothetical protein [Salmonella enterica subsp. enterica serovar Redlands]ECG1719643.1 hypothetical protein [Salmonella enterica subsp. diarizonae serovar 17:z10:e,n,x,z15]ECG5801906.1 hypothetical protein [Salmonella enterica subsp. enterica serovar Muenchen]ECI0979938.1 hypothetical protein [Salmonella enterica subsp. enterica serovar Newport]ECT9716454.1 hypothetical protein [Salmonella enterica subsp. diarizonae str. CFSAN000553]E
MFNYAVKLEHDPDTKSWIATCRDLPLFNSVGDSVDDALLESVDGAIVALSIEIDARRPIPAASQPEEGEYVIHLPVLVVMKAALHNAMIATGTRKSDLARSMGMKGPQIDRLLDVCHSSKVETVELALQQLNRTVQISVNKVAA